MPPRSKRLFTRASRFAAGGSPIGLGSLRRSALFGPGAALRTCFHASQIMMAHNVRGDIPSGLAFPGPGLVAPALVSRSLRARVARSCKPSSATIRRSGSASGPLGERQETLEPRRIIGARSQRTSLLRPQARSFSFAPGRADLPRRSDLGTATCPSAKVVRPTNSADRLG
jgi:hypothetical protein